MKSSGVIVSRSPPKTVYVGIQPDSLREAGREVKRTRAVD
jgi:hypothetical protein